MRLRILSAIAVGYLFVSPVWDCVSAADDTEQVAFFESKIRPVLIEHCYECHSATSKEPEGGLLLDTREGIRRGGETGHAVVPGELADSLIMNALRHDSIEMPPDEKLPDHVIADFEKWIQMGAIDPRDGKSAMIRRDIDFERAREFWSFQGIASPAVPAIKNASWIKNDIDAFVLSRLEAAQIKPVDDADSDVLARRIYFDLIGLPPTPDQLDAFNRAMKQDPDQAVGSLVDTLLDSRHFGERWGRHWLDVVRYAESTGMERNGTFTRAWHYRDYVIDALNDDRPYDQFIREQIAGDLLSYDSIDQRNRQLIATGMLALGPKSLNETKKEKFQMDVVDEQIDVVSRAFLGLTASCARCHDHKFDPIPQSEYYSLAGIFTSTETLYGTSKTNGNRNPGRLLAINGESVSTVAVGGGAGGNKQEKQYRTQVKALEKKLASLEQQLKKPKNAQTKVATQKRLDETRDDLRRARARLKQATQPDDVAAKEAMLVMAVAEANQIGDTKLRIRGEPDEYGKEIPRGFLTIASLEKSPDLRPEQSGRVELAQWMVSPGNPLVARVAVNRVWQHLFGRGIVNTVNNFGANGDRPTHPLLLDHLATQFVRQGWSVKDLIRTIMTSHVYRLSCDDDADALAADPGNELLWRMNQRRLEAEAIRDAMLFSSGRLDLQPPTGSPVQRMGEGIIGRNLKSDDAAMQQVSRSVYLPILRGGVPEMLSLFDFPEPSIIGGVRNVTTVPTQALFMMNNPQVIESASKLAQRIAANGDDPRDRVRLAYRLTLSRTPSESEIDRVLDYVQMTQRQLVSNDRLDDDESNEFAWAGFCQTLFASSEFRYLN
ncbi:MAG: PSD1 domain-containing protein [Planctomycetales bacterium]|nr:PSD1 domain-containing protein [Planctomycetales bacterium]